LFKGSEKKVSNDGIVNYCDYPPFFYGDFAFFLLNSKKENKYIQKGNNDS